VLLLGDEWYRLEVEESVTEVFVGNRATTASATCVIQIVKVYVQSLVQNLFRVLLSAVVWVALELARKLTNLMLVKAGSASSQGNCLFDVG
jgi:hypothetical protein